MLPRNLISDIFARSVRRNRIRFQLEKSRRLERKTKQKKKRNCAFVRRFRRKPERLIKHIITIEKFLLKRIYRDLTNLRNRTVIPGWQSLWTNREPTRYDKIILLRPRIFFLRTYRVQRRTFSWYDLRQNVNRIRWKGRVRCKRAPDAFRVQISMFVAQQKLFLSRYILFLW